MARTKRIFVRPRPHAGRALLLAGLVAGGLSVVGGGSAAAATTKSALGKVLVVSNNAYAASPEFFTASGALKSSKKNDLTQFVDETLKLTDRMAPDVVLVQEVRKESVAFLRQKFSQKVGQPYATAVDAKPLEWIVKDKIMRGTDCAILINTATMKMVKKNGRAQKGYILTKHRVEDSSGPVQEKKHAWARLAEKGTGSKPLQMTAVSLHYPRSTNFKSQALDEKYKKNWSLQIHQFINKKFPDNSPNDARMHTIAGDFNAYRLLTATTSPPFYNALTQSPIAYKDAIFRMYGQGNPIDFIFTKGNVVSAKWDEGNTHTESSPAFYSNHDLRWALIEGPDKTPPTAPAKEVKAFKTEQNKPRLQGWGISYDGGVGFEEFRIYRRQLGDTAFTEEVYATVIDDYFIGPEPLLKDEAYEFEVTAVDGAGNESRPSPVTCVGNPRELCD